MNIDKTARDIMSSSSFSQNLKVNRAIQQIKNSLEDYQSQGGKITKQLVRDSVKELGIPLNTVEKNEVISQLLNVMM
jgi:hypothetical protein